ncbi:MAG: sulfite exporter TauE/SafE family protein [Acutalibacteraceae bacterium]
MNGIIQIIAGILSGMLGAMGLGGGGILIIYLTLFTDIAQDKAQGINLLFFLPCAVIALFVYGRKKLIEWKIAVPFALFGVLGSFIGSQAARNIDNTLLTKMFGGLLILMGIRTFFVKERNNTDMLKAPLKKKK